MAGVLGLLDILLTDELSPENLVSGAEGFLVKLMVFFFGCMALASLVLSHPRLLSDAVHGRPWQAFWGCWTSCERTNCVLKIW